MRGGSGFVTTSTSPSRTNSSARGQLGSGGNRRHLLGDDFLAAGSFQVALLGGLGRPPARTVTSATGIAQPVYHSSWPPAGLRLNARSNPNVETEHAPDQRRLRV